MMIEYSEPRALNCTTRKPSSPRRFDVQPEPQFLIEELGPIEVGKRRGEDLELRVEVPLLRISALSALLMGTASMVAVSPLRRPPWGH